MNKITWSIFIAATVGLMTLLVVLSNGAKIDVSKIDVLAIQSASVQNGNIADHVYGNVESKVTLIEYGDFQCTACASQFPVTNAIMKEYKDKIKLIFRNFPLTAIHPNAKISAAAAEAAGLQGKFWEMHDLLYKNQTSWDDLTGESRVDAMVKFAEELKIDTSKFKEDMGSSAILAKISYDQAIGTKVNLQGTPTFYLNGKLMSGDDWSDIDKFKAALDAELKATATE